MSLPAKIVFLTLLLVASTPVAAQESPITLFPSGVTYQVRYLAKDLSDQICFYEVESTEPGAAIVDRDGTEGTTEADALLCEVPAQTCPEEACDPAAHANQAELSVVSVRDFLMVAVAYRHFDADHVLESGRSNLGQAVVAPSAPVMLGAAWLSDDVAGGDES